jgi:CTP:molybdopterin cytidylyltransferase MocA
MLIYALIPASGQGRRFGQPKVDALFNSLTFAQQIITTLEAAGIPDLYVIRDLETPDMLSTLRIGMHRVLEEGINPDVWLIWPVDHPSVQAETIRALMHKFEHRKNSIIIPRHHDKSGHPILLPGSFAIPEQTNPIGLKGVIIQSEFPVRYLNVDDPGILQNINTPEDALYV